MAADDSAKRRSDSFVPAVDRWYYTAKILQKQERTFIFLHFTNESFSLFNAHSAQSCNSLPNFTKFSAVFAEHCRNSDFCLIRRMERVPPPTGLKRCSLCRMRDIPPRRIGDSCSERISGLAIRRVTRYNKEHLVFCDSIIEQILKAAQKLHWAVSLGNSYQETQSVSYDFLFSPR